MTHPAGFMLDLEGTTVDNIIGPSQVPNAAVVSSPGGMPGGGKKRKSKSKKSKSKSRKSKRYSRKKRGGDHCNSPRRSLKRGGDHCNSPRRRRVMRGGMCGSQVTP